MTVAAMALKLVSVLQQRVAVPLYSFSFPKKFPVRWRHLQVSRSNSAGKRRSDPGGMSASILASAGASPGQLASNARSARSLPQDSLSMSAAVPRRSWQQRQVDQVAERVGQCLDLGASTAARMPDGLISGSPFAP